VGEYSSVWPEICRILSQIICRFLRGLSGKHYFGTIFQKFCANQGYHLPKLVKFRPTFCNFIPGPYCVEKIHTSTFICCFTQVRRHVNKQITKRRYGEEKPGRFVFGKPVLFSLGLGLTRHYSLGILVWNFYQTFVTVSVDFRLRFEHQILPTRLAIIFLFITARAERKVRLCTKLFVFFRGWILMHLTWNLLHFVPNSVQILRWIFRKKLFRDNFSEILCKPRPSSTKTCEISPYFLQFYSGSVLRWKNSHKYFHMLFAPRWGGTSINKSQKVDTGKKSQDVLFSENQFCSVSVWDLPGPTPWIFWSDILTTRLSVCLLSLGRDLSTRFFPQDWQ